MHATKLFVQWKLDFKEWFRHLASENLQTRGDAQIILLSIENFSFMSHFFYWEEIMGQINLTQKKLQEPGIGLDVCVIHMDETKIFFNRNKDRMVSESVKQNARKWKFRLKRENHLRKKKMMYVKHLCRT